MGRLDTLTKAYMKRPDIFADVFNQFLYHGKQVIAPEQLVELDTTEIAVPYGMEGKESVDVCIAIQGMLEDSRIEGKTEGIIEGAVTFAQKLGVPKEQVKKLIMDEYDKGEEEAEELIRAYWK